MILLHASIAQMYILRACRGNPCPRCRLRAGLFGKVAGRSFELRSGLVKSSNPISFEHLAIPAAVHCAENRVRQPCRTRFSPASGCRFFNKLSTLLGTLYIHYNPYKGVHVSTLEVKKSRAGCIMRPPFFFFNADTDCPHYLLGWVREPGMVLEPSPERRRRKRPSPLRMRLAATSTPWPGHSTAAAVPPSSWAFPSSGWPRWWSNSGR